MAKDPIKAAEALFKPRTLALPDEPAKGRTLPGAKATVTLAIDQDVLEHFQKDGPGWRDRINAALRQVARL